MPKLEDAKTNNRSLSRLIVFLGVFIMIVSVWLWWTKVHNSPNNVFWGMISNNLATPGITRHVVQKSSADSLDQYIQLEFGSVNAVHTRATLTQTDSSGKTVVKSETIGTPTTDFNRYLKIETPQKNKQNKPIDTSNVIDVWAKTDQSKNLAPTSNFSQSVFTIVPYGNLGYDARNSLVDYIKDNDVYDMSKPAQSIQHNGRSAYIYYIDVDPVAYIKSLEKYAKAMGLGNVGLDADMYANSPALKVELTVDKLSRQLTKIYYPDSQQEETFMSQGLQPQTILPDKTVTVEELQKRIQSIQQ